MPFAEVVRYELEHRLRTPSTWVYAALLFAFAVANAADVLPVGAVDANAPHRLAHDAALTGLVGLAVSAAIFGDAVLRDVEVGMDPLLFTLPQRPLDYLGGRYVAALATNGLLLLVVPVGHALPTLVGYPDPAHFGPFRIEAVVQLWLVLLLPNMALSGAILFAVAVLSRRLTPVYLTGFGLFIGALLLAEMGVAGLDPSGIGVLETMRVRWTVAEQNSRLIGSSAAMVWNRLLWVAVTGVVLGLLHRRFSFAHPAGRGAPRKQPDRSAAPRTVPLRAGPVTRATASFGVATTVRQTLAIARRSLTEAGGTPWFAAVLVACAVWSASLVEKAAERPFDTVTWPVTMLVTAVLSRDFLAGLYMLLALYAGELVWTNRDVGVAEITDAAPVAEGAAVLGRFLALVAMAGAFLAAGMIGGILGQFAQGYYDVEPGLYARVLFGTNLADLALIGALVLAVHVAVNHKYLGLVAALMALTVRFSGPLVRHTLLVYGGDPGWVYSDMNGFGPFLAPFVWFKLYWAGWALLLGVVANALWVRGRESGAGHRLRRARARLTGSLRRTAAVGGALTVTTGAFILYNTRVLNAARTGGAAAESRALYEQRYRRFASLPQPTIERAQLRAEIFPDDQAVELSGSFLLVNRSGALIDSIQVTTDPALATRAISFDRAATAVVTDGAVGYRLYTLARPLAPGDSVLLSFDVGFHQRGFPDSGIQTMVVRNGTSFGRGWLPFVGYHPDRERAIRGGEQVRVDITVGTSADQIAVATGELRGEWRSGGRRYFRYETAAPQSFEPTVFSGRYAVRTERWHDSSPGADTRRDVALRIYHHPTHDRNVDSLMRAMRASLTHYAAHVAPYAGSELRIVELPRYRPEARAYPGIVALSEGRFISRRQSGRVDPLFLDAARKIAR